MAFRTRRVVFQLICVCVAIAAARGATLVRHGLMAEFIAGNLSPSDLPARSFVGSNISTQGITKAWRGVTPRVFRARWFGYLVITEPGIYKFVTTSDDGSSVTIDRTRIVDNLGTHGPLTRSGQVELDAGSHFVAVDYTQEGGTYELAWQWATPRHSAEPVPAWVLSPRRVSPMRAQLAHRLDQALTISLFVFVLVVTTGTVTWGWHSAFRALHPPSGAAGPTIAETFPPIFSERPPPAVMLSLGTWLLGSAVVVITACVPALVIGANGKFVALPAIIYWWPWLAAAVIAGFLVLLWPRTWNIQRNWLVMLRDSFTTARPLVLLLTAAVAMRFMLVIRGGQYFDWDETRYGAGTTRLFEMLSGGNITSALDLLLRSPDHPGYRVVGLIPAFFHVTSAWFTGHPISDMRDPSGEWLPALLLSFASVVSIGLTYMIAVRAGGSRREGLLASFLMFASTSMIVYARHFFPYDASMAIILLALWIGLYRTDHPARSFAVGSLAGFAFLTYEGYWLMAGVVAALHIVRKPRPAASIIWRAVVTAFGFATFPALLMIAGLAMGRPFLEGMHKFSVTVTHGEFAEGWSLPWSFLWHIEHGVLIIYLTGIVAAIYLASRTHRVEEARRSATWMAAAGAIYLGLVIGSNVLQRFVVYDRLTRQMVPFFCLAAAGGFAAVTRDRSPRWAYVIYPVVAILFLLNCLPLITQQYPREVVQQLLAEYGGANVRLDTTVMHSSDATMFFLPLEATHASDATAARRYVLLNTKDIWIDGENEVKTAPTGKVILRIRHPRQLAGLQYQGYTPAQRAFIRSTDISMRLIDTQASDLDP